MLSAREHSRFNLKMKKILKDCLEEVVVKDGTGYAAPGNTSRTAENVYYYNSKAANYRDELLELCDSLPKMKTVILGTLGTIPYSNLISDSAVPEIIEKEMITADHFINLLLINHIAALDKTELENGEFVTHLHLIPHLKDKYKHFEKQIGTEDQ